MLNDKKTDTKMGYDIYIDELLNFTNEIILFLAKEGNILRASKLANNYFSNSDQEISGKNYSTLIIKDEQLLFDKIKKLPTCGYKKFETSLFLNGKARDVAWSVIGIDRRSNEFQKILVIGTDISSDKALENQKTPIQVHLEKVSLWMPGNFYWKSKHGRYLGCNQALLDTLDFNSIDKLVGKTDDDLWPEQAEELRENDRKVMESGSLVRLEETVKMRGSEETRYFTVIKRPLQDDKGEIIGIIGNSLDITELKTTKEALADQIRKTEQAHRSKGEFLTFASHEIRNPISNVIYVLQSVFDEQLNTLKDYFYEQVIDALNETNRKEVVNDIIKSFDALFESYSDAEKAAQRALNALKNLDDLHRLQLEGVEPAWDFCNIRSLLDKAIAKSTYPNDKSLKLSISIDLNVPDILTIDYQNITKALSVIIGNAFRFSKPSGRIKIKVGRSEEAPSNQLIISIQDFGQGMSASQIEELFKFENSEDPEQAQAPKYHKPSVQLLQAKMRIEASGGSLDIHSGINIGTTVTITVPYRIVEDVAQASITVKSEEQNVAHSAHLLLVEDDEGISKITAATLIELGYQVDVAGTAMQALKLAMEHQYEIVIMDLTLPDMNGLEVTRRLRKLYGDKMAFIGFTSYVSEEAIDNCYGAGMAMVLTKPVTKETFRKAIEDVLDAKRHEEDD